jgi:hypothetical protein
MISSNWHKKGGLNVLAEFFLFAVQLEYSSILYTSTPVGEPVRRGAIVHKRAEKINMNDCISSL